MSWLTYIALSFIHTFYAVYKYVSLYRRPLDDAPRPLKAPRKRLPGHLALALVSDESSPPEARQIAMMQNVELVVSWCKEVGIERLTVYDRDGMLLDSSMNLQDRLQCSESLSNSSAESEFEYPLTPPPSDTSESRTLTPEGVPPNLQLHTIHVPSRPPTRRRRDRRGVVKRRTTTRASGEPSEDCPITIHLISRMTGKPAVARVADHFLQIQSHSNTYKTSEVAYSIDDIAACLEGDRGFPPPDLMIVHDMYPPRHSQPLELHGFPPWQMRLTEFHRTEPSARTESRSHPLLLDESVLDEP